MQTGGGILENKKVSYYVLARFDFISQVNYGFAKVVGYTFGRSDPTKGLYTQPDCCMCGPRLGQAVENVVVGWIFYIGGVAAYVIDGFVLKVWFVRSELAEEEG